MTSIGETLRSERLRRNLELDRISKELKISPRMLEAMEADRFDKLPGGVFTKSFVRQYARQLGLDDQEIAASLERMLNPPTVPPEVSEATPAKPLLASSIALPHVALPRVKNWLSANDSRFAWFSSLRALALVVLVVLACAAVYSWSQRGPRPAEVANKAQVVAQTAPQPPIPAASDRASAPVDLPHATAPSEAGAERLAAPVRVQLTAGEPVWVQVTTDGKFAFSGTMQPNDSRNIDGNDRVFLKLGNAGGLRLWLNGKPVGPLGTEGEVLRVQFTSGGFQIVPAVAPTPDAGPSEPGDSPPTDPLGPL